LSGNLCKEEAGFFILVGGACLLGILRSKALFGHKIPQLEVPNEVCAPRVHSPMRVDSKAPQGTPFSRWTSALGQDFSIPLVALLTYLRQEFFGTRLFHTFSGPPYILTEFFGTRLFSSAATPEGGGGNWFFGTRLFSSAATPKGLT
jgi:hypothetical protein